MENFEFSAGLFKTVVAQNNLVHSNANGSSPNNVLISPLNLASLLMLILPGARNQSLKQLITVLTLQNLIKDNNFNVNNPTSLSNTVATKFKTISDLSSEPNITIDTANGIYPQKGLSLNTDFQSFIGQLPNTKLTEFDYIRMAAHAEQQINNDVAKATRNKIKDLIPAGTLNAMTRLVLTTAMYFKANWAKPFEKARSIPFIKDNGEYVDTDMMELSKKFPYKQISVTGLSTDEDPIKVLKLPYENKNFSLIAILPPQKKLMMLVQKLDKNLLQNFTTFERWEQNVNVQFPKFKIEYDVQMKEIFKLMGLTDIFDSNADLTGMFKNLAEKLYVSEIFHKTFIEVDEKGTEAAAASAGVIMAMSMPIYFDFRANRPFMYLLFHEPSQSILFMGTYTSPKK